MDSNKYSNLTKNDYDSIADASWPSFDQFCQHTDIPPHIYQDIDQMLILDKFEHPSFCILPFYGVEYPGGHFCCLVPPGTDREHIKSQILAGTRAPECSACWKLEDQRLRSDRLIKNETFDFYHGVSVRELYQQVQTCPDTRLICAKIDGDNTCNATCVTCQPKYSTAWGALRNIPIHQIARAYPEPEFDYAACKTIMFRGGEPFLSKNNFKILERLLSEHNDSCVVSFVTNGSIWPTRKQLETMLRFKNLIISFSIDGIGPVFDYLRYPLTWSHVRNNLKRWQDLGVELGVSYTLSNVNLMYHDQTQQWLQENNITFLVNPVVFPDWFNINSLPSFVKQQIKDLTQDATVCQLLQEHTSVDDERFERCRQEIAGQDLLKNINIRQYLPEFVDLVQW